MRSRNKTAQSVWEKAKENGRGADDRESARYTHAHATSALPEVFWKIGLVGLRYNYNDFVHGFCSRKKHFGGISSQTKSGT